MYIHVCAYKANNHLMYSLYVYIIITYTYVYTSGKQSHSIEFPLLDLTNDFTSPLCMNGITISGMPLSGLMLTPMRLRTLG